MYVEMILENELQFVAVASSGPGGQNVNKTASAVLLRWCVWSTESFSPEQKARLLSRLSSRLTNDGDLLVRSQESRNQYDNKKTCLEKLESILAAAFHRPKKRVKTKPSRAAKENRRQTKKRQSETKKMRRRVNYD